MIDMKFVNLTIRARTISTQHEHINNW